MNPEALRACPVCGSSEHKPFLSKQAAQLVECSSCSMIFLPTAEAEFTEGKFYATKGSHFYASDEKIAGDYSPVRYEREIAMLRKSCPRGRVLDVGCSTGGFLYYLGERFPGDYEVTGNDVALGALAIAEQKGIPVRRESFFSLSAPPGGYDVITFWAVLEHVAEPSAFLRKARELLAPSGHCFVLVPNLGSLAARILGSKYRYILPQHLNYFTATTLARLIRQCGFQVVSRASTHFNPVVILQDLRSQTGLVADRERAQLIVKTNALKANPLLAPLRFCYRAVERMLGAAALADNIVVVARLERP